MGNQGNNAFRHVNENIGPELVENAINGHPVLRFNEDARLFYPNLFLNDFTIFEVGKNNSDDEDFYMILGPAIGSGFNQQVRYEGSEELLLVGPGHGNDVGHYPVGNNKVYHSLTMDGEGSDWSVYPDGDFKGTEVMNGQNSWQIGSIGAWFGQHHLDGDVAELIIFDRSLEDDEREAVQCYLDQRYML